MTSAPPTAIFPSCSTARERNISAVTRETTCPVEVALQCTFTAPRKHRLTDRHTPTYHVLHVIESLPIFAVPPPRAAPFFRHTVHLDVFFRHIGTVLNFVHPVHNGQDFRTVGTLRMCIEECQSSDDACPLSISCMQDDAFHNTIVVSIRTHTKTSPLIFGYMTCGSSSYSDVPSPTSLISSHDFTPQSPGLLNCPPSLTSLRPTAAPIKADDWNSTMFYD